jgi:hypothetical protein
MCCVSPYVIVTKLVVLCCNAAVGCLIRKHDVGYDADGSMIITWHSKMLSQKKKKKKKKKKNKRRAWGW